ncbi:Uma2 family endonuclease [Synechococcales cyanobacterium C]|uniref:Uma2 family endonuclease n=1 Tax=Petrachloros mirabilis ULC683 TaxID=2781853 RepID=A0A8K1ZZZ4_9CYAN|nr:Uma2 family endonuclease [Petrachloros mirabilis]NCJ06832.1 Uma2 family endonuclease [Petrachloros mirabilis ULC683]
MIPLVLEMETADIHLSDEQFYQLCQINRDLRLERTAAGKLIIMPPTGWETGNRNLKLGQRLGNWADADGTGLGFDSSTGFILPNGATRSPDAAWVKRERLEALRPDPNQFLPLCPDFAIELRSASDDLDRVRAKMQEYLENGMQLGWLLDPYGQQVEIYRVGQPVEVLKSPKELSGETVLCGFVLQLDGILSSADDR